MKQNYINYTVDNQIGLSSGLSYKMNAFHQLHSLVSFYCLWILGSLAVMFFGLYIQSLDRYNNPKYWPKKNIKTNPYIVYDNAAVEFFLLIIPFYIVLSIIAPSVSLSYIDSEVHNPVALLKITGVQWHWQNDLEIPFATKKGYNKYPMIKLWRQSVNINLPTLKEKINFITNHKISFLQNTNTRVLVKDWLVQDLIVHGYTKKRVYQPNWLHYAYCNLQFTQNILNEGSTIPGKGPLTRNVNVATLVPAECWVKLVLDSNDVIHSYFIKDLGIKIDCTKKNPASTMTKFKHDALTTGSCTEFCGTNHFAMPIVMKSYSCTVELG